MLKLKRNASGFYTSWPWFFMLRQERGAGTFTPVPQE